MQCASGMRKARGRNKVSSVKRQIQFWNQLSRMKYKGREMLIHIQLPKIGDRLGGRGPERAGG